MRYEGKVLYRKQFVDKVVVGVRRQKNKKMRTEEIGSWVRGGGPPVGKRMMMSGPVPVL